MTFNELIEARRSVRSYAKAEISGDELKQIVAEALNAPSWKNNEETRYHVALGAEAKAALRKDALPPYNASNSANAAAPVRDARRMARARGGTNRLRRNGPPPARPCADS